MQPDDGSIPGETGSYKRKHRWQNKIPRKGQILSLESAVQNAVGYLGLKQKLEGARVLDMWGEIVGGAIANVTNAESIKDGVLCVAVFDASWRQELMFLSDQIIEKLNGELGTKSVTNIKFSLKLKDDEGLPTGK